MVGSRGKGSKSQTKRVRSGPSEPLPLKNSLDESADVASNGEGKNNDISNTKMIPLEEQMEEIISDSLSDGAEKKGQNALEVNNVEKDILTETNVDRTDNVFTQEGTIDDVKEVGDGGHTATGSFEDNEGSTNEKKLEEDEAPLEGLDKSDASGGNAIEMIAEDLSTCNKILVCSDPGVMESMTETMENHKEPSKLDADELVGMPSDELEENATITDDIKDVPGKINRPKRKVIKKIMVKKKMVRKQGTTVNREIPQPSENNNTPDNACKVGTKHANVEVKASDMDATLFEECKDNNDNVKDAEKAEVETSVKLNKKRNLIRKKKALQSHSGVENLETVQKPQSGNDELAIKEHVGIYKPHLVNEEVDKSRDKVSSSKRSIKKNVVKMGLQEMDAKDMNKSNPLKEGKSSKRDSMGMIFMCNSDTKKDCYRYKVFGLPAGKQDTVLKIYKGMRLFLFDVDLRLMYGIYKAAGAGGYNIEPRAFKSQFPSQVRFSVLEDCVPLAEEIFKKVLKDNYYTKTKFDFQLNSEQVKNLCKLFRKTNRKANSTKTTSASRRAAVTTSSAKAANASRKAAAVQAASTSRRAAAAKSSAHRDRKRKRIEDSSRGIARYFERVRSRKVAREEIRYAPMVVADREEIRRAPLVRADREEIRRAPLVVADRYYVPDREEIRRAPLVVADREEIRRAPLVRADREEIRRAPLVRADREEIRRAPLVRADREEIRRAPLVVADRYYERPVHERESYQSAVAPAPLYRPLPEYTKYSYDRVSEVDDSYRRNRVIDHRDLIPSSRESRRPIERDPYDSYSRREPTQAYRGLTYSTGRRKENYDYTSDDRYADHRVAEHRSPLHLYRRY